ncbi:MAG TPA: monovalent cation:proton antiporter-2 (CPA2) family protein [Alphaproteobacteria bacterium]|nr:monovalent cation:proton antiporter-2 (CPA2) family protein [Alphaproteobacteria bacterium]
MPPTAYLHDALIFLAAVVVVVTLFHRLRMSPVLGFLAAGLLIGPQGLGIVHDIEGPAALGELGVVFLLFAIGLELSLARLRAMRRLVLGLGGLQLLASGLLIGLAAWWLVGDARAALVIGPVLALSSTAVALRLLADRDALGSRTGRSALAVLLLQDLAVVPLLVLIPLLGRPEGGIAVAVGLAFLKAGAALLVIGLAGRLLLRPLFRHVAATRNPELFAAAVLLVAIGTAVGTEEAGLSLALGAFLAGVLVAETEYRHQVEADIQPFRGLLLGLFFMAVGMRLDLELAAARPLALLGLCLGLLAAKAAVLWLLGRRFGLGAPDSLRLALLLAGAGEFGFILFNLAVEGGTLEGGTGQLLQLAIALTMALTPFLAALAERLADRLERRREASEAAPDEAAAHLSDHVVIAGWGRVGRTVARLLEAEGQSWVALDCGIGTVRRGRKEGLPVYYGDAGQLEVLRSVGTARAAALVLTLDDPKHALHTLATVHEAWPELTVVVRARDTGHRDELLAAGAAEVVPEIVEGSLQLGGAALRSLGVDPDRAAAAIEEVRRSRYAGIGRTGDEAAAE